MKIETVAPKVRIVLGSRQQRWRRFMQQHPSFFRGHSPPPTNFLDWRRQWTR